MIQWTRVKTWRDAGINARWGKVNGAPRMFLQPSHSKNFFLLTASILDIIEEEVYLGASIKDAVNGVFAVSDIFSIPVTG